MPSCLGDICRPEAAIELKLCTERLLTNVKVTINIIIYFRPCVSFFQRRAQYSYKNIPFYTEILRQKSDKQLNDFMNARQFSRINAIAFSALTKLKAKLCYLI